MLNFGKNYQQWIFSKFNQSILGLRYAHKKNLACKKISENVWLIIKISICGCKKNHKKNKILGQFQI